MNTRIRGGWAAWEILLVLLSGCGSDAVGPPIAGLSIQMAPGNSGDQQRATVGTTLPDPLRVLVLRGAEPVPGVVVTWTASQDTLAGAQGALSAASTRTDASGIAAVRWTLTRVAGQQWAAATVSGADTGVASVSFNAVALPGPAVQLGFLVNPVNTIVGQHITPPVQVAALDAYRNVASFAGLIALRITSLTGAAALAGTTSLGAVGGLAEFTDLSVDLPGVGYTLSASMNGLPDATSAAFDVRLPPNSLALTPRLVGADLGTPTSLTATVANDAGNSGVTWTLTGAGCSGAGCGTLSAANSASGVAVTYTAPAIAPSPATVTVKAAATADPTASLSATVVITTPGVPSVYIDPTAARLVINGSRLFTGYVFNDPALGGVTWSLVNGCPTVGCGTLSAATSASGAAVTYHAPSSPGTITIKATSVTDPGQSAAATVTVFWPRRRL